MFDRFVYAPHHSSNGPSHVTVTEKRAPTDDSARLLSELERKALERVIGRIDLEGNTISCKVLQMCGAWGEKQLGIVIVVNGERTMLKVELKPFTSKEDQLQQAYEAVGKHLALHMMSKVSNAIWHGVSDE